MLHREFTELTGVQVTNEEYAKIEEQYITSPENKQEFCDKWLKEHNKRMKAERAKFRKEHSIDRLFAFMDGVASLGGHLTRYDLQIDKSVLKEVRSSNTKYYWCARPTGTELFLYNIELLQRHNCSFCSKEDYAQYEITYFGDGCWDIRLINRKMD